MLVHDISLIFSFTKQNMFSLAPLIGVLIELSSFHTKLPTRPRRFRFVSMITRQPRAVRFVGDFLLKENVPYLYNSRGLPFQVLRYPTNVWNCAVLVLATGDVRSEALL